MSDFDIKQVEGMPSEQEPGFVYDPSSAEPVSADNLPDAPELIDKVIEILTVMTEPEMKDLMKENFQEYESAMERRFPEFADRYYSMFKKVISGEDLTKLMYMLNIIGRVKKGYITMEDAEKRVGNMLADEYLNPLFS
jgi:hypothetical protein